MMRVFVLQKKNYIQNEKQKKGKKRVNMTQPIILLAQVRVDTFFLKFISSILLS